MAENVAAEPGARLTARAPLRPLAAFVARVLLFAAIAFTAWHFAAKPVSLACGWVGARVVESMAPIDSARIAYQGREVLFALPPEYEVARRRNLAAGGFFEVTASALPYSYGLPFFIALMLASHGAGFLWKIPVGAGLVVLVAGTGMGFDVLAQLSLLRTPSGESLLGFPAAMAEAISLGYRLSGLVLPPLVPVIAWIALDWRAIESLTGRAPR